MFFREVKSPCHAELQTIIAKSRLPGEISMEQIILYVRSNNRMFVPQCSDVCGRSTARPDPMRTSFLFRLGKENEVVKKVVQYVSVFPRADNDVTINITIYVKLSYWDTLHWVDIIIIFDGYPLESSWDIQSAGNIFEVKSYLQDRCLQWTAFLY